MRNSYFDGSFLDYWGYQILAALMTFLTVGLATPWAVCMVQRWQARHTVVEGRRLQFDGTGSQLFGQWIIWLVLTVITFGIYGFWVRLKMIQWVTKHTHFAD